MGTHKRKWLKWIVILGLLSPVTVSATLNAEKAYQCVIDDLRFDVYWSQWRLSIPRDTPITVETYSNDISFLVMFFTTNNIYRVVATEDKLGKIGLGEHLYYFVRNEAGPCGKLEHNIRSRLFLVDKPNAILDDTTYDKMLETLDKRERLEHDYRRFIKSYPNKVLSKTVTFNSDWEPPIETPPSPEKQALLAQFKTEQYEEFSAGYKKTLYIADFNMNWPYTFMLTESERIKPIPGKERILNRLVYQLYFVEPNKKYQYLNFPPDKRYRSFPSEKISIYVDGRWKLAEEMPDFVEKIKKRSIVMEIVKQKNSGETSK